MKAQLSRAANRILVIDPDVQSLMLIKDILETQNYTVMLARNAREAVQILKHDSSFVACIIELNIPYISGADFVRHMRTEKRLMRIPVIIMGSEARVSDHNDGFNAGALIYLPKPFTARQLRLTVDLLAGPVRLFSFIPNCS